MGTFFFNFLYFFLYFFQRFHARIAGEVALRRVHKDLVASCAKDEAANVRGAERIACDRKENQLRLRLSLEHAMVLRTLTIERASKLNDDLKHDTGLQSHRSLEFADRRQDNLEKTRLTDALSAANEAVDARSRDVSSLGGLRGRTLRSAPRPDDAFDDIPPRGCGGRRRAGQL